MRKTEIKFTTTLPEVAIEELFFAYEAIRRFISTSKVYFEGNPYTLLSIEIAVKQDGEIIKASTIAASSITGAEYTRTQNGETEWLEIFHGRGKRDVIISRSVPQSTPQPQD